MHWTFYNYIYYILKIPSSALYFAAVHSWENVYSVF